jgi:hypothetical protein
MDGELRLFKLTERGIPKVLTRDVPFEMLWKRHESFVLLAHVFVRFLETAGINNTSSQTLRGESFVPHPWNTIPR